eukprot:2642221-Prymnesium_polylepis.1
MRHIVLPIVPREYLSVEAREGKESPATWRHGQGHIPLRVRDGLCYDMLHGLGHLVHPHCCLEQCDTHRLHFEREGLKATCRGGHRVDATICAHVDDDWTLSHARVATHVARQRVVHHPTHASFCSKHKLCGAGALRQPCERCWPEGVLVPSESELLVAAPVSTAHAHSAPNAACLLGDSDQIGTVCG